MSKPPLSFLDFPREVRELCYEHLLTPRPRCNAYDNTPCGFTYTFPMTIFLLNRQVKQEAAPVLYGKNSFFIEVYPIEDERELGPMRARANMASDMITALSKSSIRPLVKSFVLKRMIADFCFKSRNAIEFMVGSDEPSMLNTLAISLLRNGPILDSLEICLFLFKARVVSHATKKKKDSRCKSTLLEYFWRLTGRVQNVKIDYVMLDVEAQRYFQKDTLVQMGLLRQQLQYHPAERASFLGLPRECRDVIYSYLTHKQHKKPMRLQWTSTSTTFPTALLRACQQIHNEAAAFLYSHMELSILIGLHSAGMVMAMVPPQYRSLIRHYNMAILERHDSPLTYEKVHDVCMELRAGPRIKSVGIEIKVTKSEQAVPEEHQDRYSFVDGFAPLADHVETFIIGVIATMEGRRDSSRDEECYRRLRRVLDGPAVWSYPCRDYQFKD